MQLASAEPRVHQARQEPARGALPINPALLYHTQITHDLAGSWSALAALGPGESACGLDQDCAAWCWGRLVAPNGSLASYPTPQPVSGNHTWRQLAVGDGVGCGVLAEGEAAAGEAYCWGSNATGLLLGPGGANYSLSPVPLAPGFGPWDRLSVGTNSACGILVNGSAYCWWVSARRFAMGLQLSSVAPPCRLQRKQGNSAAQVKLALCPAGDTTRWGSLAIIRLQSSAGCRRFGLARTPRGLTSQ